MKLLLIGIDQAIPYLINKFIEEGTTPNISRLCDNGVLAEAYSCAPCDTPTNWTTIATGATTANHGATSFYMHLQGEALDLGATLRSRTQLSRYCKAEYLWDVADKFNLKSFIFNYPSGWPGNLNNGIMSLFTWKIPESYPRMIAPSKTYKFNINFKTENTRLQMKIKNKNIFTPLSQDIYLKKNKDGTILYSINGVENPIKEKYWSTWLDININTVHGLLPCLYRIKITDLNDNNITLKRSAIYNTKLWTNPESFGGKLIKNVFEYDFPQDQDVEFMINEQISSYLISARNESLMLAESIKYANTYLNWDICYFHYHPLDSVNHDSLAYLHKDSPLYTEKKAERTFKNVETAYKIVDELVGNLVKSCVDRNTIVVFLSDHGAIPIWKIVNIPQYFQRSGLTKYTWNETEKRYFIDWNESLAFPYMEPPFVWINLKGREKYGIVKNSEYEKTRDLVINTLYDLRDPDTNEKIIKIALRREEANYLGLNGERIGDIIYFLKPSYGLFDGNLDALNAGLMTEKTYSKPIVENSRSFFGAHAYYLPNTIFGDFSVSVPFIISGPGIKKGIKQNNNVNLIDIAPTLSYLLNIPVPKNSEGKILYELMD